MVLPAARNLRPRTMASTKFASITATSSVLPLRRVAGITLVPTEAGTATPMVVVVRVVGRRLAMSPTPPSLLAGGNPGRFYTRLANSSLYPSMTGHMRNYILEPLFAFLPVRCKVAVLQRLFLQAAKVQLQSGSVTVTITFDKKHP